MTVSTTKTTIMMTKKHPIGSISAGSPFLSAGSSGGGGQERRGPMTGFMSPDSGYRDPLVPPRAKYKRLCSAGAGDDRERATGPGERGGRGRAVIDGPVPQG